MTSTRVLLVGQAPGPSTDPRLPLYPVPATSAGGRLQQMMGISRGDYLKKFDRVNLLPYFPGKHKRDDKFPMPPARLAAQVMRPLLAGRRVVLVGRGVASAFGLEQEFHVWTRMDAGIRHCLLAGRPSWAEVAVVPHPSGRNRWYNDPANLLASQAFWSEMLSQ